MKRTRSFKQFTLTTVRDPAVVSATAAMKTPQRRRSENHRCAFRSGSSRQATNHPPTPRTTLRDGRAAGDLERLAERGKGPALPPDNLAQSTRLSTLHRRGTESSSDSPLEEAGFEPVWGFSWQVNVFDLWPSSLFGAGSRSSSRRLRLGSRERAEGVKGPKR